MLAYRLDVLTGEQIAATDPFQGAGLFLDTGPLGQEEAGLLISELFGNVPFVTFGSGAWLDASALPGEMTARKALVIWRDRWVSPGQRSGGDGD